jgi:predicted GNAT family acetyltransferase
MTIQHKRTGSKGMFYVEYEGEIAAEMIYTMPSEDKMIIEHTEVDEVLQGQNVGYELVHAGVEYARHHGLKIIATCPFARAILQKKPDWADVMA